MNIFLPPLPPPYLSVSAVRPELAEKLRGLISLHGPLPPKPLPTSLTMPGHVHAVSQSHPLICLSCMPCGTLTAKKTLHRPGHPFSTLLHVDYQNVEVNFLTFPWYTLSPSSSQLEMAGLGGLAGPGGMATGLVTPSFHGGATLGGAALGGPPAPASPVGGKTGLPGSATGLAGLSQIQQHVRKL